MHDSGLSAFHLREVFGLTAVLNHSDRLHDLVVFAMVFFHCFVVALEACPRLFSLQATDSISTPVWDRRMQSTYHGGVESLAELQTHFLCKVATFFAGKTLEGI